MGGSGEKEEEREGKKIREKKRKKKREKERRGKEEGDQAEEGIRDGHVTGVQTCAVPIRGGTGYLLGLGSGCGSADDANSSC